ncbi:hypothetical protein AWB91_09080 [Mycobacterium paraense]|uniref:Uncharacterized protein n=1 Tax=Mycobacterium paraense TaxID=767916 RepID=A0ABX3VSX7_9MYCO|nr:hypothetical protein [Mycobacterium paraense]ORW33269.1 hypothetical protein AWB91_09080 [Mycobacterium paraense]ORW34670.1 hypothetical protein AWB88_02695 [Mycobacterium paraense]
MSSEPLTGLKALHGELTAAVRRTEQLIAAAEDKPQQPAGILDTHRTVLESVPVPPGAAADVWRPSSQPHTFLRWVIVQEATVLDGDRLVGLVMVAGVQSATFAQVDGELRIAKVELTGWCIQTDVQGVLNSGQAKELSRALSEAAAFLEKLEPVTRVDELARRRARHR